MNTAPPEIIVDDAIAFFMDIARRLSAAGLSLPLSS